MNSSTQESRAILLNPDQGTNAFWHLRLQRFLSHVFLVPTYLFFWCSMRLVMRYKVPKIREIRKKFRDITSQNRNPLIICANHLTMADSMVLVCALGSPWYYFRHFHLLAWNLPEKNNFYSSLFSRLCCYLGKCLPVVRGGTKEETKKTFEKVSHLLYSGDSIMIFPEGTRSRQGRVAVESCSYAVGKFLQRAPAAKVICFYLRGLGQHSYSKFPKYKEEFYADIKGLSPKTSSQGMRGARDLSLQIINELVEMEKGYFEYPKNNR
ncbi:1-acyl-sn-glycerol-3-phosphate acyltransferase [bacterium]|nr:1-acyl-sn-glycerol-3-phosphate acyltransferase [bacterium]MBU1919005.1 1-acyl-sn-glycerol-3-phosphate acyltransferase [bacterium]